MVDKKDPVPMDILNQEWQTRHAFQQHDIEVLSDVIQQQQQQIDQLQTRLVLLEKRLQSLSTSTTSPFDPDQERPPHY